MSVNVCKVEGAARKEKSNLHSSDVMNAIFYFVFNVAIHKLRKIQFWKELFAIEFPYKHCLTATATSPIREDGAENRDKAH